MRFDDRRNLPLIEVLKRDAAREVKSDGAIHVTTSIALAENGIDPDSLQERLQFELNNDN